MLLMRINEKFITIILCYKCTMRACFVHTCKQNVLNANFSWIVIGIKIGLSFDCYVSA